MVRLIDRGRRKIEKKAKGEDSKKDADEFVQAQQQWWANGQKWNNGGRMAENRKKRGRVVVGGPRLSIIKEGWAATS